MVLGKRMVVGAAVLGILGGGLAVSQTPMSSQERAEYLHKMQQILPADPSFDGWIPMRTDVAAHGDGGVARYSHERGLIPKLGVFVGHESQIPYDYRDLMGMIAPRPPLIVQPQLDCDPTPADVEAAIKQTKQIYALYGAGDKLSLNEPWDYNRLTNKTLDETVKWMGLNLP